MKAGSREQRWHLSKPYAKVRCSKVTRAHRCWAHARASRQRYRCVGCGQDGARNAPACTMCAICAFACACSCARRTRSRTDACTHLRLIMSIVCCWRHSTVLDCSRPWPGDGGTRRVELPEHYCVQGQPSHACSMLWRARRHERVANLTSQHRGDEPHAHCGLGEAQQLLFAHVRRAGHLSPLIKPVSAPVSALT